MRPLQNRIRTEISADLYAFMKSLPSGDGGAFGELTIARHSGSLFGFISSLTPEYYYVVKVACHHRRGLSFPHWFEPGYNSW